MIPVALQLYSVRDYSKNDFLGTLEKVSKIGYKGVEFAGFFDVKASKLKSHLDSLGLKAAGSHTALDILLNNLDEVMDYNLEIGNKYIVCPYTKYTCKEEYISLSKSLNSIGERCRANGLVLVYHNHAHELESFDGRYGLDILYEESDEEYVKAEIDTYWVQYGGVDPVQYIKKYSGRCPLLHIKDMEEGTRDFAEIGNGTIDIKSIASAAEEIGTEWLIVEQDKCKRPAMESVSISFENLRKMNLI